MKKNLLLVIMLASSFTVSQAQITNGLAAYYPFGGNTQDQSGNMNNGQINGNVTLISDRFGTADCAYHFDGDTGTYIRINASPTIDMTNGQFSISLWCQGASAGMSNLEILFAQQETQQSSWNAYNYFLALYDLNKATFGNAWEPDSLVDTAQWSFYTAVYDNGVDKLYKNAVLVDSVQGVPINLSNHNYVIGRSYSGSIDDVRYYNRSLNTAEISEIYALAGSCSTTGTEDIQLENVSAYPNPANDHIDIRSDNLSGQTQIDIYNITGQKVLQQTVNGQQTIRISTSDLASGTYLLKLMNNGKISFHKFQKVN